MPVISVLESIYTGVNTTFSSKLFRSLIILTMNKLFLFVVLYLGLVSFQQCRYPAYVEMCSDAEDYTYLDADALCLCQVCDSHCLMTTGEIGRFMWKVTSTPHELYSVECHD